MNTITHNFTLSRTPVIYSITLVLLFLFTLPLNSQTVENAVITDSVRVFFRQGKSIFEPDLNNNGARIDSLIARIKDMQVGPVLELQQIHVQATSSPEGTYEINHRLAESRADCIADYLTRYAHFNRKSLTVDFRETDWALLESLVEESNWSSKAKALEIIRKHHDDKAIKQENPSIYNYLYEQFYPRMRGTTVFVQYSLNYPEVEEIHDIGMDDFLFEPLPIEPLHVEPMQYNPVLPPEPGHWYIKTNFLPMPLMLTPNIGFGFEIGDHFSVSIPFYYSALDWFRRDRKFRIAGLQPEVRYWFRNGTFLGPFVGAHATFGWWNIAAGDGYRYQDHEGKHPTLGGGIQAGWKIPLFTKSKHPDRFGLEFTIGAGYMHLYSDKFYDVVNGMKVDEIHKDYFGIDNAAVSLTYKMNYKRRGQK